MSDTPQDVLERFFPAMFGDDADTLSELLHPQVEWHVPPFVADRFGALEGRDTVVGFLCSAGGDFYQPGTSSLEIEVQAVEDDRAIVLGKIRAVLAKGGPYENRYAFAFRFADGRIREVFELLDSLHFRQQLDVHAEPGLE
jgi:ketosteroid isomerase-like protein